MSLVQLNNLLRKGSFKHFDLQLKYKTDPILTYGVVYDKQVIIDGVESCYGKLDKKVAVWRIVTKKQAHFGVARLGDEMFIIGNLIAFYWIHKIEFDRKGATKEEWYVSLEWMCKHILENNSMVGYVFKDLIKYDKGNQWKFLIDQMWKDKDLDMYSEEMQSYAVFFTMSDIFPGDEISARLIQCQLAKNIAMNYVDVVRETMQVNDKWVTKRVIEEGNTLESYKLDQPFEQGNFTRSEAIGVLVTEHRMRQYWRDELGVTKQDRDILWLEEVLNTTEISTMKELKDYMGISNYKLGTLLPPEGPLSKDEFDVTMLIVALKRSRSKEDFHNRYTMSESTFRRRRDKSGEAMFLWKQLPKA